MKSKNVLVLLFLLVAPFTYGQEILKISPAFPERGQEITIQYNPNAPGAMIPANAEKIEMVFTYSNFYEVANTVALERKGNIWEAKIPLARYATYATFYLISGDIRDQPAKDKHYGIPVYDKGKRVFNGYLYESYSISAQTGKVPDLAERQAKLVARELENYPDNYEAKLNSLKFKMLTASGSEKEKFTKEAEDIIAAKFYENPGKMALMNKTTMGYLIIGQSTRLDSIRQVVKEKYPNSEAGFEMRIADIKREEDKAKMEQQLLALLKQAVNTDREYSNPAHTALLEYYASKKQTAKALYHLGKLRIDTTPYRGETLKKRAEIFYNAGIALDTALSLASRSLAMAETFPAGLVRFFPETGHIPSYVTPEARLKTTNKAKGNLMSLMALIKLKQGNKEAAAELVKHAIEFSDDKETLTNLANYYTKTGNSKEAFSAYKKIMFTSAEDTASFAKMKKAYLAYNKNLTGLDEHIAELNESWNKEMVAYLKKNIIKIESPEFVSALVDLKGQTLPKEFIKNKIVVLDFWATWCVPCMHEMPYLQNVYNKYQDRDDVVFMVINSGSKNTLEDASGWWGNKKYSFPVYYNNDPMIGEKLKFNVIPATYIIDKKGDIRFKTIGFEGPVVERKLSAAIEILLADQVM